MLRRAYRYPSGDVAEEIERLLMIDSLVVDHQAEVYAAVTLVQDGIGEFPDALLGLLNASAGRQRTLTFDRRARRIPGFEIL